MWQRCSTFTCNYIHLIGQDTGQPRFTVFWGKPVMQTCWMVGTAPHKSRRFRLIQFRQTHASKPGCTIFATDKYTVGSKYRSGTTLGALKMRRYPHNTTYDVWTWNLTTHSDITPPHLPRPWTRQLTQSNVN